MKRYNKTFRALLSLVMTLAMLAALVPAAFAEGQTQITILSTSDLHSNIWGYAYEDDKESANNGMARVFTYVQQVRAEANTLLVDGGDTLQGTIMTDDLYNKQEGEHPVVTAMNHMGYDAMTLGNHEFNFGLPLVDRLVAQAKFPVLAANAANKDDGSLLTGKGWTIVEKAGVKVAIIGATNPNVPTWDGEKVDSVSFEDMSAAVKRCIAEIDGKADIIMVSAHSGLVAEFDEDGGSDAAQKILDENPEVDVLQVGHFHNIVKEQNGTVVVGAARNAGRDVVRFDLTLDGSNEIVSSSVDVVDMADYAPSQELRDLPIVKESHQKTIDFIQGGSSEDGETGGKLGATTAKFQPVDEIAGLPAGKLMDTAVMDLINTVQLENSGADVSAAALFKDTSDLPEGDINYGNIFNIYKFDNTLYKVPVTGKELKAYMEWSAECYNQWVPGDINISFDSEYPGYLYDMFAGVTYELDLSQPKGQRVKNVMFKGEPLKDDQELTLAVNNYRYSSALKSGGLVEGKKVWESPNSIRDMLVQYFAQHSPVAPAVDNNWKITGVDLSLNDPNRATLIALINNGQMEAPYGKSLNLNDESTKAVLASSNNVSVDGVSKTAAAVTVDGTSYYRLRDLAAALNGTAAQFNVTWENEVIVASKTAYSTESLLLPAAGKTAPVADITFTLDGAQVTHPAVLILDNYYVSAGCVETFGVRATEADGILTLTTK